MLTAAQLEKRRNNIGASDVPALLGVSPWSTTYDLWLEKTGQVDPLEENEAMRDGNRLEQAVLDFAAETLGPISRRNSERRYPGSRLLVHLDASVFFGDNILCPVEAKTSGIRSPLSPDWGDSGTDEVPMGVVAQCMAQMMCFRSTPPHAYVPAFLGGRGFAMFVIPYRQDIADVILEAISTFWTAYVEPHVPPEDSHATLEMAKRIRRTPGTIGTVNEQTLLEFADAKASAKGATARVDAAKALLLEELGDCEAGIVEENGEAVTYFEQTRRPYRVDEATFRVLRHKPKGL